MSLDNMDIYGPVTVTIVDASGKIVAKERCTQGGAKKLLRTARSHLSPGGYIVQVGIAGKRCVVAKIISR